MKRHWTSLNRYLTAADVFGRATAACPACGGDALGMFSDGPLGGLWYACPCGFAGDGVEVYARRRGIEATAAASRLARRAPGVPDEARAAAAVRGYVRDHVEYRARVAAFWESCRSAAPAAAYDDVAPILTQLGVMGQIRSDRWRSRCGAFVGVTTRTAFEEAFFSGSIAARRRQRNNADPRIKTGYRVNARTARAAFFHGPGWRGLVVVPFWDRPGRISGFMLIGREGGKDDVVYYRPPDPVQDVGPLRSLGDDDAGLAMLPAALTPHPDLPGTVVVATDVMAAVKLQAAHMVDHDRPLPLVAAWRTKSRRSRAVYGEAGLPPRRVFWSPLGGTSALVQAKAVDGLAVPTAPRTRDGRAAELAERRPLAALREAAASGVPWRAAFALTAPQLASGDVLRLVEALDLTRAQAAELAECCPAVVRQAVESSEERIATQQRVTINGRVVREDRTGWYAQYRGREELITNAPFQITHIIYLPKSQTMRYAGRLRLGDMSVDFEAPGRQFEADPFGWLYQHAVFSRLGVTTYNPAWNRLAIEVAKQLRPPQLAHGADGVGWSDESASFNFAGFSIAGGGAVGPGLPGLSEDSPGASLPHPDEMTVDDLASLGSGEAAAAFWAVLAYVLADAASPAVRWPRTRLLAVGGGAHRLADYAAPCGCVEDDLRRRCNYGELVAELKTRAAADAWPFVAGRLQGLASRRPPAKLLPDMPAGVMVQGLREWTAPLALLGGWTFVDLPDVPPPPVDSAARVTSAAIRRVASLRGLFPQSANAVDRVLRALSDWLSELEAPRTGALRAATRLSLDGAKSVEAAARAVFGRMVALGVLPPAAPHDPGAAGGVAGGAFVPAAAFREALAADKLPPVPPEAAAAALRRAGLLIRESCDGPAGWWVPTRLLTTEEEAACLTT